MCSLNLSFNAIIQIIVYLSGKYRPQKLSVNQNVLFLSMFTSK